MNSDRVERRKLNTQTVNSGALATLAGLVALAVLTIQSRTPGLWYAVLALGSAICLVASMVVGGRAVARLSEEHMLFEWQTRLCLLGLALGLLSLLVMGPSHDEETRLEVHELRGQVIRAQGRLDTIAMNRGAIDTSLASLGRKVDSLRWHIDQLSTHDRRNIR